MRDLYKFVAAGLTACMTCLPSLALGITISYQVADLADLVPGEDLWQYSFQIDDHVFQADEGFTVYFDPLLYASIEDPPPAKPDWDILSLQPDLGLLVPGAGSYDALALVDGAATVDPFLVSFVWLGGTDNAPGQQPFMLYALDVDGDVSVLAEGNTRFDVPAAVPEAGTLWLLATGLPMLVWRRRPVPGQARSRRTSAESLVAATPL